MNDQQPINPTFIWDIGTAYDFFAFKTNIEELQAGGGSFTTVNKFIGSGYIYFVGVVTGG